MRKKQVKTIPDPLQSAVERANNLSHKNLIWVVVISFIGVSLYFSTCNFDFSADDGMYTFYNNATKAGLAKTGDLFRYGSMHFLSINPINSGTYRPITLFTFALEKQITGEFKPVYGHILNIFLYFLILISMGRLLLKLFNAKGLPVHIPLLILFLYAVHPLHVEVVASIKSRDTLLSAVFGFWAINFWLRNYANKSWAVNWGIGILFLIALLSKEEALTLIAVVFLIAFYFRNENAYESFKGTAPFLIAGIVFLVIRSIVLDASTSNYDNLLNNILFNAHGSERLATNLYIYLYYIKLLIFPHPLSWDYSFNQIPIKTFGNTWVLVSLIFFSGLLWYGFRTIGKRTITGFSILIYLSMFSIYSNITPSITIGSTLGERFMFLPSLGFCIFLVYGMYLLLKRFKIGKPAVILTGIVALIGLTYASTCMSRIPVWRDNLSLCKSGIKDAPNSWRTHMLLGEELRLKALRVNTDSASLRQNNDSAIQTFKNAVYHYNKGYSIIDNKIKQLNYLQGLGECYLHLGDTVTAKGYFLRASENPKLFFAQFKLGMISFNEKNYAQAVTYYEKAVQAESPDLFSTYKNLGAARLKLKDYHKAIEAYEKALEHGTSSELKSNLAMLYSSIGNFDKADKLISNPKLTKEEIMFHNLMNAGSGAYNQGKYAEAIQYFKQCDPLFEKFGGYSKFPDFLNSWARSSLNLNKIAESKAIFQRVIGKDPKNYYAMMNLGNIAFNNENNYPLATFYFSKCIEANSPDYFLSYSNLGTLYLIQNMPDKAIRSYENSLKYGSSQIVIRNLFLLWKSKGNQEKMAFYKALITQ